MSENYESYRKKITITDKKYLDGIYIDKFKIHKKRIEEGIIENQNHLSLLNLCANFFQHDTPLHKNHGYRVVLCEPFYEKKIKNFDIGVFNREKKTLLLIECKYSISNIGDVLNVIQEAMEISDDLKSEYEAILGNKIEKIEYVICTDGVNAHQVVDKIFEKNMPLITWACNIPRKELRLFITRREDDGQAYLANRVHYDREFNRTLYDGAKSNLGMSRLFKIIPSLNSGIILTEINMTLKEMINREEVGENDIDYTKIFHIMESRLSYSKTFESGNVEDLAERIIKKALIKDMYEIYEEGDNDVKKQKYKFTRSLSKRSNISENTHNNYINLNAKHKAESDAIEELNKSGRLPSLDRFTETE